MGSLSFLRRFISSDDRTGWVRYRFLKKLSERIYAPIEDNDGIYVLDADWDNLIILDACRYDTFAELESELSANGTLSKVRSRGTRTVEFLRENFPNTYDDIVYVSVNPFIMTVLNDPFYKTIYVEKSERDEKAGAVLPETVLEATLEAHERYPHKRLIVHFLQPHHPFIGDTEIERSFRTDPDGTRHKAENPWRLFAKGEISEVLLRQSYRDNLRQAFPAVEELVEQVPGKTVLTSDHGESFGSRARALPWQIYEHGGPRIDELVEVPWYEFEFQERKTIWAGESKQRAAHPGKEDLEKRLRNLGYRD